MRSSSNSRDGTVKLYGGHAVSVRYQIYPGIDTRSNGGV